MTLTQNKNNYNMSQKINEEISMILNGKTSSILDKLETLRKEMNEEMNGHFEQAFKVNKIDFNVCKLYGVNTANQKMVLLYLQNRRSATNTQIVKDTGLNKLTVYRYVCEQLPKIIVIIINNNFYFFYIMDLLSEMEIHFAQLIMGPAATEQCQIDVAQTR